MTQLDLTGQPGKADRRPPGDRLIGDWLLTFHVDPPVRPSRVPGAVWRLVQAGDGWQLWMSVADDAWAGTPVRSYVLDEWECWLLGELFGSMDAAALLRSVVLGERPAAEMNGHFLLLAYNRQTNEWHIWTNRFATLHAYFATNGRQTAVGTYCPAVAAAAGNADLDWENITCFFGFGFYPGDRTYFRGVHTLRPAIHYRFQPDGQLAARSRYWNWDHQPDEQRSYDETVDSFAALFLAVMTELTADGRVAVPISGGLDSRSTVAAIRKAGAGNDRFWSYSYGYSDDSLEMRIAGQVAAAGNLPFIPITIRPYLFDRLQQIGRTLEGFQDIVVARQAYIHEILKNNTQSVIAAHWGDVYLNDMGLAGVGPGAKSPVEVIDYARRKISKPSTWLLDAVCRPQLGGTLPQDILHEVIAAEMAPYASIAEPDFRLKAFKTDNWSARWTTASLRTYQSSVFPRLPFYDNRLVDFFMTVPTQYVAGRRLQIDYLKRYAPDLAAVTWQVTGTNLYDNKHRRWRDVTNAYLEKGWRHIAGKRTIERNWEVQFLNSQGRKGLNTWLLGQGLLIHDFVPRRQIEEYITAFFDNPFTEYRGFTLSMLLSFATWLEQLAGREETS